jgi:DNA-directed RNA polymerase specialized sigma24 family protein
MLQTALTHKALLITTFRGQTSRQGRSLNDEISYSDPLNLKSLTRLTALDKAEIVARAWRGQNSAGIAQIFGVTSRTVNRVIREQSNARK